MKVRSTPCPVVRVERPVAVIAFEPPKPVLNTTRTVVTVPPVIPEPEVMVDEEAAVAEIPETPSEVERDIRSAFSSPSMWAFNSASALSACGSLQPFAA